MLNMTRKRFFIITSLINHFFSATEYLRFIYFCIF